MRFSPALILSLMALGVGGTTLDTGLNWEPDLEIPQVAPAPVTQLVKAVRTSTIQDAALLQTLNERPPFTPGRRPPQPATLALAETAEAQAAPDLPVPTVRGIALSGQSSVAIVVLESESNRLHRITIGGEIAGWRVTDIQRESVTFSNETSAAKAYLSKPGEEPRVETTRHDAELAEKKDTDNTRLSSGGQM